MTYAVRKSGAKKVCSPPTCDVHSRNMRYPLNVVDSGPPSRKYGSFAEELPKLTFGKDERLKSVGDKPKYRACPAYPETSGMPHR